jgi:hypothetical protein
MDTVRIIQEIDAQISRLQQARGILASPVQAVSSTLADQPTKRVMSVEARAKIAAAQKARWAKSKRAGRKAAKKAATAKTGPAKKVAKKQVKSAKQVKATKLVKEGESGAQG